MHFYAYQSLEEPPKGSSKGEPTSHIPHFVHILLNEVDKTQFHLHMTQFVNYWEDREPQFIHYFNTYYKDRASETNNYMYLLNE